MRIGLIEDNEDFRAEVAFHLGRAGFEIVFQSDGRDIDALFSQSACDLLVLDLGLPGEDGLGVAKRLRAADPKLRIVMLTARGATQARIIGLSEGADAYLVKPVDMRELVAVLQSLERRLPEIPSDASEPGWALDRRALLLQAPSGDMIAITAREAAILELLAQTGNAVTSRTQLVQVLVQSYPDSDERRLEVAISRLRQKIGSDACGAPLIRSVRNQGYTFTAPILIKN